MSKEIILKAEISISEGWISYDVPDAGKPVSTWFKIVGDLSTAMPPLIALHGGPGAGHSYLSPLIDLYRIQNIPIIFYDQIGCGNSTHFREKMGDESFWTIDLFIRELENLIDHLELRYRGFSILGQSWGGVLAGTFASQQPVGLKKLVIASGPSDISLYIKGTQKLLGELPDDVRKTLEDCEKRGDFESPEYERASMVFSKRHTCRLDSWPQPLMETMQNLKDDPTAYMTMQGPCEFHVNGTLRGWEGWSKASKIEVETLLTNGQYDEVQDISIWPWFHNIRKVKWVKFANSSHMAQWEEREKFIEIVGEFLMSQGNS